MLYKSKRKNSTHVSIFEPCGYVYVLPPHELWVANRSAVETNGLQTGMIRGAYGTGSACPCRRVYAGRPRKRSKMPREGRARQIMRASVWYTERRCENEYFAKAEFNVWCPSLGGITPLGHDSCGNGSRPIKRESSLFRLGAWEREERRGTK